MTEEKKAYEPQDEQPREMTKAEKFAANPDQFEDLSTVMISIKLDPETGNPMMLNNCKNFRDVALMKLTFERNISRFLDYLEHQAKQQMPQIARPNMMQALRNGFKKR